MRREGEEEGGVRRGRECVSEKERERERERKRERERERTNEPTFSSFLVLLGSRRVIIVKSVPT